MPDYKQLAETYMLENHPDKYEIFTTCQKITLDVEHYWCYLKDKVTEDLYAEEPSEFIGVFKKDQNGYKMADYTIPYPSEDELLAVVKELHVKGEDMKKSKWQLLAEAHING